MFKWDALLAIHNFGELKRLANNAKIRSSLKCLLIWYIKRAKCLILSLSPFLSFHSLIQFEYHIYLTGNMIIELFLCKQTKASLIKKYWWLLYINTLYIEDYNVIYEAKTHCRMFRLELTL